MSHYIERNLFYLLHNIAPIHGDQLIKEWLYDVGIDMQETYRDDNYTEGCSHPLLMHTIDWDSIDLCKFFIRLGADINAADNEGHNALMWAIWNRSHDMIKFLLDEGICINHQDEDGYTALLILLDSSFPAGEKEKIANILIEYDADPTIKNKNGVSALDLAQEKADSFFKTKEDIEILKLLRWTRRNH